MSKQILLVELEMFHLQHVRFDMHSLNSRFLRLHRWLEAGGSVVCGSGEDVAVGLGSRGSRSSDNAWRCSRAWDTGLRHADLAAWQHTTSGLQKFPDSFCKARTQNPPRRSWRKSVLGTVFWQKVLFWNELKWNETMLFSENMYLSINCGINFKKIWYLHITLRCNTSFCFNDIQCSKFIFPSICTMTFLISVPVDSNYPLESADRGWYKPTQAGLYLSPQCYSNINSYPFGKRKTTKELEAIWCWT